MVRWGARLDCNHDIWGVRDVPELGEVLPCAYCGLLGAAPMRSVVDVVTSEVQRDPSGRR